MSIVHDELVGFQHFAEEKIQSGNVESLDELFDLWRLEHPTADEQDDVHTAIRTGLTDIEAGRFRAADQVTAELRAKYGN